MKVQQILAVITAVFASANANAIGYETHLINPDHHTNTNTPIGRPIGWYKCPGLGVEVLPHPEVCNKYIVCKYKLAYEVDCRPSWFVFDERWKKCVPSTGKCEKGSTTTSEVPPTEEPTQPTTTPPVTEQPTTRIPTDPPRTTTTQAPSTEPASPSTTSESPEEPTDEPTTLAPTTQPPPEETTEVSTETPTQPPTDAPTTQPPTTLPPTETTTTPPPTTTVAPSTEAPTQVPTSTDAPEPSTTEQSGGPPKAGDPCDPMICRNTGYCQSYLRCDRETSRLVEEQCGDGMFWNPFNPNGTDQIHGGNCDFLENLSPELEKELRSDPECLACFWKATGECEPEYLYQPPGQNNRNVLTLRCSEGLVFSQKKETCQLCDAVARADGSTCCDNDK